MIARFVLAILFSCLLILPTFAQAPDGDAKPDIDPQELVKHMGLETQTGNITLPGGLAKLVLPPDLGYLNAEQTKKVVEELWGNPPGQQYLGMIVKNAADVLSDEGVSAIITYDDSGHVSDEDASSIDYSKLLTTMQASEAEANKQRKEQGFPGIHLVGWAEAPHYDKGSNKLYWAKEIAFEGEPEHTLNYCIRALGRQGVLELNFVGSSKQLGKVRELAPEVMKAVMFTPGNQYSDFNESTDRMAGYGLAALVAGGVAAKAGLFKVLIAALLVGKKFVIIAVIAIFALLGKLFSWRKRSA